MVELQLAEIAEGIGGRLVGEDVSVHSVSTDTRTLEKGDFFVALKGPAFNGHDYLQQAVDREASAAMVSEERAPLLPVVHVEDTRLGLGQLAALWRQRANARVIGITGSNGKTTVKEMLASILAREGSVLATRGNLNNDIGVPLTLTRLQSEDFAVVEMGANSPGEIDYLSKIARPDVAVLNNAGRAHLEGFKDQAGVARAKLEIINGLVDDGVFVFNADDQFAPLWREAATSRSCITFGMVQPADVRSSADSARFNWTDSGFSNDFMVQIPGANLEIKLQLAGQHNQMNALAATAAAHALGVPADSIESGLAAVKPVPGRLCSVRGITGCRLLDDSYNANPESVATAVDVLKTAPGRRVLVLGDLGELGETEQSLHAEIGLLAKRAGIDLLFTCGALSAAAAEAFGSGATHTENQDALISKLRAGIAQGDTLLIKGSRTAAMDRVVAALQEGGNGC